jgi:hypothetical protein
MNCVFTGGNMMGKQDSIRVCSKEGERLNGLGMMMLQYLEQNFTDFEYEESGGKVMPAVYTGNWYIGKKRFASRCEKGKT